MCDGSYADLFESMYEMWQELELYILTQYKEQKEYKNCFEDVYKKMLDLKVKYDWLDTRDFEVCWAQWGDCGSITKNITALGIKYSDNTTRFEDR